MTKDTARGATIVVAVTGLVMLLVAMWRGRSIAEPLEYTIVGIVIVGFLYLVSRRSGE